MSSIYQRVETLISGINKRTFNINAIKNRTKIIISHTFKKYSRTDLFPTVVHIELTNICDLKCIMCPISVMKREKGYMNIQLFRKIISELSSSPVETVGLSLFGESLLHKEFTDFLRIAKAAGLNVFLSTNGLNLSEELAHVIIDNSLDLLIISYDSQNPEIYKNIRQRGNLDILNRNLEEFLRLKGKHLPVTVLQCIEFPDRQRQSEQIRNRWKHFNVKVAMRPAHGWLGDISEINKIVFQEEKKDKNYGICDQPWRHAVIFWNGDVSPCCNFYDAQFTLGNLYNESLAEIWNGKAAKKFRKKHIKLVRSQIKECSTCRQRSPSFTERISLVLLDMATVNTYLSTTDGWRDQSIQEARKV